MTWMPLLKSAQGASRIRFRAMMESGALVDEMADVIQTQVVAQKATASIRNRDGVGRYLQTEEGRPPVWVENVLVETGQANPPGTESRHVLEDSLNLWLGYKTGTVDSSGGAALSNKHVGVAALVGGVLVFFVCAWLASFNLAEPSIVEEKDNVADTHGPLSPTPAPFSEEASGPNGADSADGPGAPPEGGDVEPVSADAVDTDAIGDTPGSAP